MILHLGMMVIVRNHVNVSIRDLEAIKDRMMNQDEPTVQTHRAIIELIQMYKYKDEDFEKRQIRNYNDLIRSHLKFFSLIYNVVLGEFQKDCIARVSEDAAARPGRFVTFCFKHV